MKLNNKNVIKISFAFSIVMLFWIGYDFTIPLLLDNVFGLPDHIRGLVMGFDNLLSITLLPLFGRLSDKTNTKYGKRTPFVFVGTICAVVLMIFVPMTAKLQFDEAMAMREDILATMDSEKLAEFYDDAKEGRNLKYCDYTYLQNSDIDRETYINLRYIELSTEGDGYFKTIDGEKFEITKAAYEQIEKDNQQYSQYARPGINTYISDQVYDNITLKDPSTLIIYMIVLFFVLVAMASFRSPAVALMPDITPKPFRSQANAIINLAGGAGGAIAFITYTVWFAMRPHSYVEIFVTMGAFMLLLLFIFLKIVDEPKLVQEKIMQCAKYGIVEECDEIKTGTKEEQAKLGKSKNVSLLLILASVFFFFLGFYAIQTNLSIYATRNLLFEPSVAGLITAISMGVSALAFIPVGFLAVKIGRKKSILIGFAVASSAFLLNFLFVRPDATRIFFGLFFLLGGIGMIVTNVNTFPMVVELSKAGNVGKYTGYYYVAAMSGQAIAPFLGGIFMSIKAQYLFLYAAICISIAFILMILVKHGDSRPVIPDKKAGFKENGEKEEDFSMEVNRHIKASPYYRSCASAFEEAEKLPYNMDYDRYKNIKYTDKD